MELPALLLPFVVSLHLFLLLVGVPDLLDLGYCLLTFTL